MNLNVHSHFPDRQCVTFVIGEEGRCTENIGLSSFHSLPSLHILQGQSRLYPTHQDSQT